MSDINPYQQPQSDVMPAGRGGSITIVAPRRVGIGDALGWIGEGLRMLSGHWGAVLGALVVAFLINVALQFFPLLGGLIAMFVMNLLYAGIVKMFYRIDTEGRSDFADLFAAFSEKTAPVVLLAVIQLVIYLLVIVAMVAMMMGVMGFDASSLQSMEHGAMPAAMSGSLIGMMGLFLLVFVVVGMLFYFAIPLVFLGDMGIGEAIGSSFRACLKNILPLIVYGLVAMVMLLVGAIPLLLGWLFVMPVLAGAYYQSFKAVFVE
ncbi:MAG: BPSS1780 family membrane protein [Alcanivorax sp.]|nr:BPSS1780 family membrane protein [Alcanivorax sp.]